MHKPLTIFIISVFLLLSCTENTHTPKPKGYNRIDIPQYTYLTYTGDKFSFEYSDLAKVAQPKDTLGEMWFDINYPKLNARIYLTYLPISRNTLKNLINDSYNLAYSHSLKAQNISQSVYKNDERKVYGVIYNIEGNVATPSQFFLTDSTSNFLRASFYFDTKMNTDSLAPITKVVRDDIFKFIESFNWQSSN